MSRDTPHTIGLIVRALDTHGEWRGERQGLRITILRTAQPDLEGRRLVWQAWTVGTKRKETLRTGRAGTVTECLAWIEARKAEAKP
jgi:hypothetical protein